MGNLIYNMVMMYDILEATMMKLPIINLIKVYSM